MERDRFLTPARDQAGPATALTAPLASLATVGAVTIAALATAPALLGASATGRGEAGNTGEAVRSGAPADGAPPVPAAPVNPPASLEAARERRRGGRRERGERGDRPREERRQRRRTGPAPAVGDETDAPGVPAPTSDPTAVLGTPAPALDATGTPAAGAANLLPAPVQPAPVARPLLVAPKLDAHANSARAVERLRVQKEAAERAIFQAGEVTAVVAPLVRHVNAVTEQLNESQVTLGRLSAERDALRMRLAEVEGVPVEQLDVVPLAERFGAEKPQARTARAGGRATEAPASEQADTPALRLFRRAGVIIPDDASDEEFKRAARKRQAIAIVAFAAIGVGMYLAQRNGADVSNLSRDSLGQIQYIGVVMQIFLVAWLFYRVVRVGGRGARWLFPQQNSRRRRR